ncbi:MAG: ABC transporter ATP-binding protein [Deltaproteobacteria bacterium]|nr:ABC transporter ATP-binding protein [Deltaproteobacteria bacterium]
MTLLSLLDVSKRFGGLAAVSGVSFSVREGEVLGLIGPNGAGKTTLFNLITSAFPPSGGSIRFRGEPLEDLKPHAIARRGISRTFQNIRLFAQMTARENIMVGRHARSRAGIWRSVLRTRGQRAEEARIREKTEELLDLMGLAGCGELPAGKLPYGHQRRLEIARALAAEPGLLLLDAPAAGMNDKETREIRQLIRTIRGLGVTVLLIEHDMSLVMEVCDRLVVLNFGQKIAEGTPEAVRGNPEVVEAYLGREEDDEDA